MSEGWRLACWFWGLDAPLTGREPGSKSLFGRRAVMSVLPEVDVTAEREAVQRTDRRRRPYT